jgi:aspartokinase/homoserine dehydrogenase 1
LFIMRVLKFGGTSVGSPESIRRVASILMQAQATSPSRDALTPNDRSTGQASPIVAVVSAFQGVTDQLITLARSAASGADYRAQFTALEERHLATINDLLAVQVRSRVLVQAKMWLNELADLLHGVAIIGELSPRTQDAAMSFGERLSAYILTQYLRAQNVPAEFLDTRPLITTDARFGAARVAIARTYQNIRDYFATHPTLQIATGFIGATEDQQTTTLGRGGSDYTAALIGAALQADEIAIWTDVDGVLTADPRKVPQAFPLTSLTYEEAMELAHFGAKVIFPPSIQPALLCRIPLRIKNTFHPEFAGTLISDVAFPNPFPIKGLSSIDHIALLRLQGSGMIGGVGIAMRLFGALAREQISVILITQASSEHSICFAVEPQIAGRARRCVEEEFALEIQAHQIDPVVMEPEQAIIAAVGEQMRQRPGIAGKVFQALGNQQINVVAIAQGSSELNISMVIDRAEEVRALRALHTAFFTQTHAPLHLFVVGTGTIGKTLLRQIAQQAPHLAAERSLALRLVGITNSRRMLLDEQGIALAAWEERLSQAAEEAQLERFVQRATQLRLPHSVLVDCTASEAVPSYYEAVLRAGIAIVTSNKRGNTASYEQYLHLQQAAREHRVKYLYETTVGAGLPVISTLRDLRASGDIIQQIEAVLSGTLNFIGTMLAAGMPFSEAVRAAQARGYTEPDPREDLRGMDIARKLLILARELGLPLELADVHVEHLLPPPCWQAASLEDFYRELAQEDQRFAERAAQEGKVLRAIAHLQNGQAQVGLQAVDHDHPFYRLADSDNSVVITTARYRERPLVIQGPGAGAEVTAAGVFADILRVVE